MVQPERAGPLFISASVAQWQSTRDSTDTRGRIPNRPWLHDSLRMPVIRDSASHTMRRSDSGTKHHKAVTTCQESARPHANSKKTRPHSSRSAKHGMRSAGSAECQSTTPPKRTRATNHTILTTSTQSANTPNSNSTQQASDQATPAATGSEATVTRQHQSEHSQDNG